MMTTVPSGSYRDRPVGEVVAEDYARAAAFKRLGIDFCCGGGRSVAEACEQAGVSIEDAERELDGAGRASGSESWADARDWDLDLLVSWIERMHHRYVRKTLPALRQFSEKIAKVHGPRHPELLEIHGLVMELGTELERHMEEEESDLFRRIEALDTASKAGDSEPFEASIDSLEDDHEDAGAAMRRIRELSRGFVPPAAACATWRATYALLEEFETDLHRHVHLENNILFPRAAELQTRMLAPQVEEAGSR